MNMGSLATHFTTFIFLCPLGIRRLLCTFSLYLNNPSLYRSKTWYFSDPKWKNFDFFTLVIALPIASFSDFVLFLTFSGHPIYRFAFLQQSEVVSLFWVLVILILAREYYDPLAIPEKFVYIFAGISFLIEYLMIGRGITGLGGVVYELLGQLTLVCASCCFYLSIRPSAFFAEFLLSSGLVFKGTWALQAGLSLYTDTFALLRCEKISMSPAPGDSNFDVKCELEADRFRGIALMNLLFVGHAIAILIVSFVLFGLLHRNQKLRFGEANGPLLARIEPESVLMPAVPAFELE